jgi:phage/plasmid-like protein (TIGR03299 family)
MHLLDNTNGTIRMAYAVGEKPWHGLGVEVDPNDHPEIWRRKANMMWENIKIPALYRWDDDWRTSGQFFIARNDNGNILSPRTVSSDYWVHSIGDIIAFMSDLCKEAGYQMETLISIQGGRKITALAKASADTVVGGVSLGYIRNDNDVIQNYVLITTSFDGTLKTTITITRVRVVCWNTLQQALGQGLEVLRVSHRNKFQAENVHNALGFIEDSHKPFIELASEMSEIRLDDGQRQSFFLRVVSNNRLADIRELDREDPDRKAIATKVNRLIHYHNVEGSGSDNIRNLSTANGTLWGALNDVTGVSDHWGTKRGKEGRFASSTFGTRRKQKDLAWEIATEVVARKAA